MRRPWLVVLLAALLSPATAWAGNSDEVNAGLDTTLTGGAVVAITYTGAALWYNPAGLARATKASLELTGVTLQVQIVKAPGLLTIDTDPQAKSEGKTVNFSVIPQAVTFTIGLRENLKLGVGLFNSSIRRAFYTEQVTTAPGVTPEARAVGGQNTKVDFFHVSAGLAGTFGKKQKLLLGGAFDFVVASARNDGTTAVFYDGGDSGFVTEGEVSTDTGFGLQLKTGIQWVPIPEVRLGLSVASPTFAFVVIERFANTFSQSPQRSGGSEFREAKGGWWGVEPGNLRFGIAYVGNWGWVEADLVVNWRLRTPDLEINQRATVNGRIGSAFRLVRFTHLGLGLFTDRSPVDQLGATPLATIDVNYYGVHLGLLFANHDMHPGRPDVESDPKDRAGFAIGIGLRYSHGRGQALGVLFPAQYDPSSIIRSPSNGKVNEIAFNLGVKFSL